MRKSDFLVGCAIACSLPAVPTLAQDTGASDDRQPSEIAAIARLDAASATPKAYPYFHQQRFERNPPPV